MSSMCSNHYIFTQTILEIIICDLLLNMQSHLAYFTQACVETCEFFKQMYTSFVDPFHYIDLLVTKL
jgi:hypothetical protein